LLRKAIGRSSVSSALAATSAANDGYPSASCPLQMVREPASWLFVDVSRPFNTMIRSW
jgi:hypothetical protein